MQNTKITIGHSQLLADQYDDGCYLIHWCSKNFFYTFTILWLIFLHVPLTLELVTPSLFLSVSLCLLRLESNTVAFTQKKNFTNRVVSYQQTNATTNANNSCKQLILVTFFKDAIYKKFSLPLDIVNYQPTNVMTNAI